LVETMKNAPGGLERSGAAQGLAECLASLGAAKTREQLDALLPLSTHPAVGVREGLLWLLSFLPTAMAAGHQGQDFSPFLEKDALPVVLAGLSDEFESVRDVALRAGQVLVNTHGAQKKRGGGVGGEGSANRTSEDGVGAPLTPPPHPHPTQPITRIKPDPPLNP
jgi:hypothetical protein